MRYIPINDPLPFHAFAYDAAVASEIAKAQGKFSQVFDDLFLGRTQLDRKSLNVYLHQQGLPPVVPTRAAKVFAAKVDAALRLGVALGVHATPTMLVLNNKGKLVEVHGQSALQQALE